MIARRMFTPETGGPLTLAPRGLVTSPHALASAAGIGALRAGGSAVDAAIATSAVLNVVYPHMTSVGGDAFWLIYDALGRGRRRLLRRAGRGLDPASRRPSAPRRLVKAGGVEA